MVLAYTVVDGDSDVDGISINADMLTLNGGQVYRSVNALRGLDGKSIAPNPAELTHEALSADSGHKVETASTDATLSGLSLSGVTLAPAFDPATTDYTADVGNDVTQTTVSPTTNDDGATYAVKLGGVTDADGVIALSVGENVITVEVTAEDGSTVKTYTVTVTRAAPPSTDATLSGLSLSSVTLAPAFDPASIDYTADVGNGVTETTVNPDGERRRGDLRRQARRRDRRRCGDPSVSGARTSSPWR